jgi:hypothetical protein
MSSHLMAIDPLPYPKPKLTVALDTAVILPCSTVPFEVT